MITKWYKNICATMLQQHGQDYYGYLPVKGTNGTTYYGAGMYSAFPRTIANLLSLNVNTAGFVLGTGTTAVTNEDYRTETPVTSGLSATTTYTRGLDNGNPYIEYTLNVVNSLSSDIVVTEIAYDQAVQAATTQGGTTMTTAVVCLDHTLLDSPVTIPAGGSNAIKYRLTTVLS